MSKFTSADLKSALEVVLRFWTARPELKFNEVTLEQLKADIARYETMLVEVDQAEEALVVLRNDRKKLAVQMDKLVKRFRSHAKGYFGDDSTEYELVGGTRTSERKRPVRRATTAVQERKAA